MGEGGSVTTMGCESLQTCSLLLQDQKDTDMLLCFYVHVFILDLVIIASNQKSWEEKIQRFVYMTLTFGSANY